MPRRRIDLLILLAGCLDVLGMVLAKLDNATAWASASLSRMVVLGNIEVSDGDG